MPSPATPDIVEELVRESEPLLCEADAATPPQPGVCGRRFLVTGGTGYLGDRIVRKLLLDGAERVNVLDLGPRRPRPMTSELERLFAERVMFYKGDIRSFDQVDSAAAGVDAVFHVASYGLSGRDMLQRKLIHEINVGGTRNVIQACVKNSVPHLVYTSSYNVVFGGCSLENIDESYPNVPPERHVDEYSRTKTIAEQMVLAASGATLPDGGRLSTVALRAAGIYGEEEERHFPRVLWLCQIGFLTSIRVDNPKSLCDWVHIDNLVHSHVLAAEKLINPTSRQVVTGRPYAISDQSPINNWEFFRPFIEGMGFRYPAVRVPMAPAFCAALLVEIVHWLISPVWNFNPIMNRTEIMKVSITHYCNPRGAQQDLGYYPVVSPQEGMRRTVEYFQQLQAKTAAPPSIVLRWLVMAALFFFVVLFSQVLTA